MTERERERERDRLTERDRERSSRLGEERERERERERTTRFGERERERATRLAERERDRESRLDDRASRLTGERERDRESPPRFSDLDLVLELSRGLNGCRKKVLQSASIWEMFPKAKTLTPIRSAIASSSLATWTWHVRHRGTWSGCATWSDCATTGNEPTCKVVFQYFFVAFRRKQNREYCHRSE